MNAKEKMDNKIANLTNAELCEVWDTIDQQPLTADVLVVRGALLGEFEKRDAAKMEAWLDSLEDSPKRFFN